MKGSETVSSLERTSLGTTDMEITRVGFGSWALGGGDWVSSWGDQSDQKSIEAIRYTVESGANWIDTAAVYGLGHSEEIVAEAVRPYSDDDRPLVFTKGGMVWNPDDRRRSSSRQGAELVLRRQVDDSLRRLGTDRIDLYFMHWPADDTGVEDYWQTLLALKEEGKLRAIGLSNHTVQHLEIAETIGHVDVIQPPFSAIDRSAAESLLPWCVAHGTGAVVYSPMGSGLLTGAFSRERVEGLPEDDWRRRSPAFTTDLDANLSRADAIAEVARRHGVTPAAVAVAWTLGFPGVSGAIVGARSPEQAAGWLPAAELVLDEEDYAAISAELTPVR
jgi:aryl-alcohol dehydrogenase-like predicted oxidoreductase